MLCLASFSGAIAPLSGQLNLGDQQKLYHKTKLQESYAVSPFPCRIGLGLTMTLHFYTQLTY